MSALQTQKSIEVVMCIVAVLTHSVESLMSVDVRVTLYVDALISRTLCTRGVVGILSQVQRSQGA